MGREVTLKENGAENVGVFQETDSLYCQENQWL